MKPTHKFQVKPVLPPVLEPLRRLVHNIHWDWNVAAKSLFVRLDPDLWQQTCHNPVAMLGLVDQARLDELARDDGFIAHMERAIEQLDDYLQQHTWYHKSRGETKGSECYAYFCAEYGLSYCLPIYSGGLGILAGDHLKSASDLGLPLVAVGLLYQEGYFAQYLNHDGWQQEEYPINDFYNMPLHLEKDDQGQELIIEVEFPGRIVYARVWRIDVGTVPLYMLDTNIEQNTNPYDHDLTDELYGGDRDLRLHQEILLGIGGVRMLEKLGYKPTVYHMNEGHSAFLILERIRKLMQEEGLTFRHAKQFALSTQMFTTHTPVSAGFDLFSPEQTLHYVGHYAEKFGLSADRFLGLGRENTGDLEAPFNMAIFALKHSAFINGVSQLHGQVSREMFRSLWPDFPLDEVGITSITNGVHARSVTAPATQDLYDRYLAPNWDEVPAESHIWEKVTTIPNEELWRNHERQRSDLVVYIRQHLVNQLQKQGATEAAIAKARQVLKPNLLTIGFARRFATYKRANLFLYDIERIKKIILGNPERQVQFVIAGKAHPKDIPGKELIRQIIHTVREEGLEDYVVFLPNYNIHIARKMVSGCDVWLNTPRRPREASGTSGMKAAMNGLPNLSILDGWWDEADYIRTGWAIGHGEIYDDQNYQDRVEASALYELLEKEIVPLFYTRNSFDVPEGWVNKMKEAIRLNCPTFNTSRMLRDYAQKAYFKLSDRHFELKQNNYQAVQQLADWKSQLFKEWYNIRVEAFEVAESAEIDIQQPVHVKAILDLAGLTADDLAVQIYLGTINDQDELVDGISYPMTVQGMTPDQKAIYQGVVQYQKSGYQGMALRILPHHPHLDNATEPRLIRWA
ncbi:MAG: alpha-glucan family phosphorylase [Synechococcus sp.]|nr:alpha-glucan family phosphorylase [Synechococcus sp.]